MQRRYERLAACACAAALLAACGGERPAPATQAPPTTVPATAPASDELQPLSSRDGAVPSTAAPADTLPPGHPPIGSGQTASAPPLPADAKGAVNGSVEAAAAHKAKINGGALFFIARNKAGQIVAVRRSEDVALPQKFQLSAADAMTMGTAFEGPLDITARWSQRGDAMPSPGDIQGVARDVAVGSTIKIVLSEVRK
jgi:cytochrome c-type biogenesis protein CcmH